MKATFKKIGPIKQAELELGDLTIIAGQNNTGKTYLVYTLYGFLNMLEKNEIPFREFYRRQGLYEKTDRIVEQIVDTGRATIGIEEWRKIENKLINAASLLFSSRLLNQVFSSSNGEFRHSNFSIRAKEDNSIGIIQYGRGTKDNRAKMKSSFKDKKLVLELNNSEEFPPSKKDISIGIDLLLWRTMQRNYPEPFILSAERFGISLFYKELDFTKNRLVEELQKLSDEKRFDPLKFLEKESARYARPIKDNIDFTRDLSRIKNQKSSLPQDKLHSIDNIMDGYYKAKNDEIRFVSKRRGDNRFDIPLYLASSSARGVSDLYFYLKHIAKPGQILIIDEPESHISPTNQILMARLLVFCVNSGLKVLITTHSDYLIKEINNLIMLNGDFEGKDRFLIRNKKDYTKDDCLNPKSVKAYICKDGTLQPCEVDERGIDMPVFDDAIDKINRISNDLSLLKKSDDPQDD